MMTQMNVGEGKKFVVKGNDALLKE